MTDETDRVLVKNSSDHGSGIEALTEPAVPAQHRAPAPADPTQEQVASPEAEAPAEQPADDAEAEPKQPKAPKSA